MMPCLFVLLVISGILALFTSPNAMEGLKYYIVPNFSDFTFTSFSNACVQCMFSIGIGWTLYVTLGSRMSEDQNIKKDAIWICVLDTLAAVLAGFVVIPSVVGAGSVMQAGPSLVFVAMPQIFAGMAIGRFLGFLFFAILILAVISSMFTFIEIPAAVVEEHLRVSHKKAVIITSLAVFVFAILCCWSQGSAGILSGVELPFVSMSGVATLSIIDWVDSFSSYILMPLGNICVALFVWRVWGFARYEKELTANGRDGSLSKFSKFVIIVAIPVFSVICLLNVFGFIA